MVAHKDSCGNGVCFQDCCCSCTVDKCYICKDGYNESTEMRERMCNARWYFHERFVCIKCRLYQKRNVIRYYNGLKNGQSRLDEYNKSRQCYKCHMPLDEISYKFRIPKRNDTKGWERLKGLIEAHSL